MANNILIGLGIFGILSTGSVAVVANTQSLVQQEGSPLLEASEILLPPESGTGITLPPLESPTPSAEGSLADSATPGDSQVSPVPSSSAPAPLATAVTPAPVPVDATSGGSSYSDEEDYEDDDDDDDEDYEDDEDDDHEDDDD